MLASHTGHTHAAATGRRGLTVISVTVCVSLSRLICYKTVMILLLLSAKADGLFSVRRPGGRRVSAAASFPAVTRQHRHAVPVSATRRSLLRRRSVSLSRVSSVFFFPLRFISGRNQVFPEQWNRCLSTDFISRHFAENSFYYGIICL